MEKSIDRVMTRRTSIITAGIMLSFATAAASLHPASAADGGGYREAGVPAVIQTPINQVSASGRRDDDIQSPTKPSDAGTVQYISGGVGQSGMRDIYAEEHAYNLKILFVSKGAYLSDIGVDIKDSKGDTVLSTTTEGPVLLVKIKPGRYMVATKSDSGTDVTQAVDVAKDHLASYVLRYADSQQ